MAALAAAPVRGGMKHAVSLSAPFLVEEWRWRCCVSAFNGGVAVGGALTPLQ